jgi:hypothetical protein
VVAPRPPEELETVRQIGEMWDSARGELGRLREFAERAAEMAKAMANRTAVKTEREAALLKLGEAYYKLVADGQATAPAALKRIIGEVRAKDADLLRQQADIAAILKEADAMADRASKAAKAAKKRPGK